MVEGNGLIENLYDQKIKLSELQKKLDNEIKPLEAKLTTIEKAQADAVIVH